MSFVLWEILIPLIIAFLLGLLLGWLWWGWRRTKITYTEWETMRQKASRASSVEAEAELVELRAENERLESALADCESSKASTADLGTGVLGVSGAAAVAEAEAASDDTASDDTASDDTASDDTASEEAPAEDAPAEEAADEAAAAEVADAVVGDERHPYGEGSHAPFADDPHRAPEGMDIKGNADSMLYHRPDSRVYRATIAEVWFDSAQRAEDSGFALAGSHPKDTVIADADRPVSGGERHPFGLGSHAPFSDDPKAMPAGYPIKGNVDSMLYHREDSRNYGATIAEVWFESPEAAEAGGFTLASSHPS